MANTLFGDDERIRNAMAQIALVAHERRRTHGPLGPHDELESIEVASDYGYATVRIKVQYKK